VFFGDANGDLASVTLQISRWGVTDTQAVTDPPALQMANSSRYTTTLTCADSSPNPITIFVQVTDARGGSAFRTHDFICED
jgi:hypothetical protein